MAEAVRAEGCRVMSNPLTIAVNAVLCGKGYTAREANYGVGFFETTSVGITKSNVINFAKHAGRMIDILRDEGRVGRFTIRCWPSPSPSTAKRAATTRSSITYSECPSTNRRAINVLENVFKQAAAYFALVVSLYLMALVLWATVGS